MPRVGDRHRQPLPPFGWLPARRLLPPFPLASPGARHFAIYTCHTKIFLIKWKLNFVN